jgi:hypothetical protein
MLMTSDYPFGIFKLFFHWNFQTWCPFRNIELSSTPLIVKFFVVFLTKLDLPRGARVAEWVRSLDLTTHTSLSPIRRGFAPGFVNYKQICTRLTGFSAGTPASSTTKTGRHDIAEILLKVALKHQKSINQTKLDLPRYKNIDI